MNNPCIRCGKQRIDGKTWEDKIGVSTVTYTMTICPDSECQKLVDQDIADKKAKNESLLRAKKARSTLGHGRNHIQ